MKQFENRINLGTTLSSNEEYLKMAKELKEERLELNRVINLLHKENGYMMSFYDAFVNYLNIDESTPVVEVNEEYIKGITLKEFEESANLCDKLFDAIISNGGYVGNPFIFYKNQNWIPGVTKRNVLNKVEIYIKALTELIDSVKAFNLDNAVSLELNQTVLNSLRKFLESDKAIINCIPSLIGSDIASLDKIILPIIEKGKQLQESIRFLNTDFQPTIFDLDFEKDQREYNELESVFFIKRINGRNNLFKKVKPMIKDLKKFKAKDLPLIYNGLRNIKENEKAIRSQMELCQIAFGNLTEYDPRTFDFVLFEEKYNYTKEIIKNFSKTFDLATLSFLIAKVQTFSIKDKEPVLHNMEKIENIGKEMQNEIGFDFSVCSKYSIDAEKLLEMLKRLIERIDYLPNWCSLLKVKQEIIDHKLDFILDLVEKEEAITSNLESIYKKSIYSFIISRAISGDEKGSFNSIELKRHIENYKELISKFKELTIKETAAKVSAMMPSINMDSPVSSEQGILNKAIKNNCRGKAIRQLFKEVPDILTKIFPVFLMSPMSCAQYLSPDMPKFDIVIFDEASQMPTCEAIGPISRGKSLIVVGDSKQLPPTTFFQSKGNDDFDLDLEDQDSILEDCDVIGMPSRRLNWHYRSKHESLIRFSNAKFYENSLITFPSPNDLVTKVTFINTNGVYGEKRATNEIEAKAIVEEVQRRLMDPELRKKSIGIVTFSSVQQEMVDDLLQDLFAKHKDLEKINFDSKEPIIVKNLENIQGDERDVILFSICYGPNEKGKLYYRFGPINNAGGEKRLNVAVSRARYEMVVYASFEPERLANMRTESRGAQELYHFLMYAKYGVNALTVPNGSVIENKVGFEKQIAEKLEERGYKVCIDVGRSSFKVDIGVINPDNKDEYILGILCDSYSYENALTSKDRNIVQPNALDLLGWNLFRVWSFDYYDSPNQVVNEICEKIEDIRAHPENYKHSLSGNFQMSIKFEQKEIELVNFAKPYSVYSKVNNNFRGYSNEIYEKLKIVREILELEAPISEGMLKERFASAIGATRNSETIQNDLKNCLVMIGALKNTNYAKTKHFYWLKNQKTDLDFYRVSYDKTRSLLDVPKEEIFVAIKQCLINGGAMSKDELKHLVIKLFDERALIKSIEDVIDDCLFYYFEKGFLTLIDDGTRVALKLEEKNKN